MVAICNKDVVSNAVNTVSDRLIAEYNNFNFGGNNSGRDINTLYQNTALFNFFLNDPQVVDMITYESYPNIFTRINDNGFITPYEVETFINESLIFTYEDFIRDVFEPNSVTEFVTGSTDPFVSVGTNPTDVLILVYDPIEYERIIVEFEYYLGTQYPSNESMSSFCDMVPSIFEKLQKFTNLFNNFKALIGKISDKINKIKNIIAGKSLSQLMDVVTNYVKSIFEKEMKRLENLVVGKIVEVQQMGARIAGRMTNLIEDAKRFFTKETLDEIIGTVKAQIQYVLDFFKDPDIEEIQYIIARFCTLLSTLKHIFQSKISPIKKLAQTYNETNLALKTSSNLATSKALRAGALRFEPQVYEASNASYSNFVHERSGQEGGNYNPAAIAITADDIDGVTPWNNGNGDSRIGFQGGWIAGMGSIGWTEVDDTVQVMLMQVQKEFGKRLLVNSGYRSPAYNSKVGGAKASLHMKKKALDITWSGYSGANSSESQRFIGICRGVGFKGFGGYSGFIHIDIGTPRDWGTLDGRIY